MFGKDRDSKKENDVGKDRDGGAFSFLLLGRIFWLVGLGCLLLLFGFPLFVLTFFPTTSGEGF